MTETDCFMCRAEIQTPFVRESALWRTFINRNQDLLGKTIIALKRHEDDVTRIREDEWLELRDEMRWAVERIRVAFAPDHFNFSFLMNMDHHAHLHVIPRYVGTRELAGVVFADVDYPSAYQRAPTHAQISSPAVIFAVHAALCGRCVSFAVGP
jgi:diadenosine tetraphosphate (Ap4A) HIT family hydrolase